MVSLVQLKPSQGICRSDEIDGDDIEKYTLELQEFVFIV